MVCFYASQCSADNERLVKRHSECSHAAES